MYYSLRIYRMHDFDLMTLFTAADIPIQKTVKTILHSYLKGNMYQIDISQSSIGDIPAKDLPYIKTVRLHLNETTDADVIRMLSQIKDGYKNCFIKNIIRMYILPFSCSLFFEDGQNAPQIRTEIKAVPALHKGNNEKIQHQKKEQTVKAQSENKTLKDTKPKIEKIAHPIPETVKQEPAPQNNSQNSFDFFSSLMA